MRRPIVPIALAAAALATAPVAVAPAAEARPVASAAKACSSGFVHGVIDGSQKCLRAGEYCAHAYDHRAPHHWPYTHYGYRCIKRDRNGAYHLTYR